MISQVNPQKLENNNTQLITIFTIDEYYHLLPAVTGNFNFSLTYKYLSSSLTLQ